MMRSKASQMLVFGLLALTLPASSMSPVSKTEESKSNEQPKLHHKAERLLDILDGYLVCQLMEAHVMYEEHTAVNHVGDSREIIHNCLTTAAQEDDGASGMVYTLPESIVSAIESENMQTQQTIQIVGAQAYRSPDSDDIIIVSGDSDVVILPGPPVRRLIAKNFGTNTVLALRVTSLDASVSLNATTMSSRLFSGAGATLSSVYQDCSWNALKLVPAGGQGIIDGVAEIFINQNTIGATPQSLENAVTLAAQAQVPSFDNIDHIMYCMPAGMAGAWVAYGYVYWYRTVFNNEWCGFVSAAVHEIGHNLGMAHSSKGIVEYGDKQGMMGYSYRKIGAPSMCFNAHKHWLLGWYQSRSVSVNLSDGAWRGSVVAFADYDQAQTGEYVIVNVEKLYIQYNRAKKFNAGTSEKGNQLTVVRAENEESASFVLGGIDQVNSTLRYIDVESGHLVTIEVCSASENGDKSIFAVSIYLDTQNSNCGQIPLSTVRPSTNSPTQIPTRVPTSAPFSARPTQLPTRSPTLSPTNSPTPVPSALPTQLPTRSPTLSPTNAPTPAPSARPTQLPTRSPKLFLTNAPRPAPSARPTQLPRRSPTLFPTKAPRTAPFSLRPTLFPPSRVPTALPAVHSGMNEAFLCDDSRNDRFYVQNTTRYEPCVWLAARPAYQLILCDKGHPSGARDICAETCGKCTDSCTENPKDTFYDEIGSKRDCNWLSLRNDKQDLFCKSGHAAYTKCPETCNVCDGKAVQATPISTVPTMLIATRLPTSAPTQFSAATSQVCDDDRWGRFYVEDTGKAEPCVWLAARPLYQATLCSEDHPSKARAVCRETCGACSDSCTENPREKFIADDGLVRDCLWLSLRNSKQDILCHEGQKAFEVCPETCGTCDR